MNKNDKNENNNKEYIKYWIKEFEKIKKEVSSNIEEQSIAKIKFTDNDTSLNDNYVNVLNWKQIKREDSLNQQENIILNEFRNNQEKNNFNDSDDNEEFKNLILEWKKIKKEESISSFDENNMENFKIIKDNNEPKENDELFENKKIKKEKLLNESLSANESKTKGVQLLTDKDEKSVNDEFLEKIEEWKKIKKEDFSKIDKSNIKNIDDEVIQKIYLSFEDSKRQEKVKNENILNIFENNMERDQQKTNNNEIVEKFLLYKDKIEWERIKKEENNFNDNTLSITMKELNGEALDELNLNDIGGMENKEVEIEHLEDTTTNDFFLLPSNSSSNDILKNTSSPNSSILSLPSNSSLSSPLLLRSTSSSALPSSPLLLNSTSSTSSTHLYSPIPYREYATIDEIGKNDNSYPNNDPNTILEGDLINELKSMKKKKIYKSSDNNNSPFIKSIKNNSSNSYYSSSNNTNSNNSIFEIQNSQRKLLSSIMLKEIKTEGSENENDYDYDHEMNIDTPTSEIINLDISDDMEMNTEMDTDTELELISSTSGNQYHSNEIYSDNSINRYLLPSSPTHTLTFSSSSSIFTENSEDSTITPLSPTSSLTIIPYFLEMDIEKINKEEINKNKEKRENEIKHKPHMNDNFMDVDLLNKEILKSSMIELDSKIEEKKSNIKNSQEVKKYLSLSIESDKAKNLKINEAQSSKNNSEMDNNVNWNKKENEYEENHLEQELELLFSSSSSFSSSSNKDIVSTVSTKKDPIIERIATSQHYYKIIKSKGNQSNEKISDSVHYLFFLFVQDYIEKGDKVWEFK
ncbi:hypothetical protein H8356DRAFT_1065779 [Neocallimastix lanati (nom. inval.)]|uniref:Uncharacterized protein n=1 Tax=Neocallimastix californiae TaxID=1754190 RepID=A0A1Y2AKI0_9FUNG|nr:hypothetical protein H8356DRAFT_1065779 [Neocallimastix sp. JGI-2020a]ORY23004.1 hypothetical protein LY90DRAFT_675630 [Neocallimastix californiae]|eukprot:ORY23004.1 hypothetical protein LY90DRAFT_675630 [Neocallimastix californiae]